jgi:alcohol dehydrogenase, propanol-preferring
LKAAQVIKPKEPLEIRSIPTPDPKGKQVLVDVLSAGVCHSDLHIWEGGYEGVKGEIMKVEERGVRFPLTLGHEIAGTVEDIGSEVSNIGKSQRVVVYPWIGDGTCPACQIGDENLCDHPRSLGVMQNGGYAQKVLVPDEKYLVSTDDLDHDSVSSLACSGLTSFTAVKNANTSPKQTMVIIGIGGLGLMAVQLARALLNPNIIAVDIDDKRLKQAERLGADHIVNSKSGDAITQVKDLTNGLGADAVVDFVNDPKTVGPAIDMLRKRGRLVLVGLFGGSVELNLPLIPLRSYHIIGSYTGRLADLADLVGLAKRHIIKPIVSKTFKLDEANEAITQLKSGRIIGRAVINP